MLVPELDSRREGTLTAHAAKAELSTPKGIPKPYPNTAAASPGRHGRLDAMMTQPAFAHALSVASTQTDSVQVSNLPQPHSVSKLTFRRPRHRVSMSVDKLPPVEIPPELRSVRVLGLGMSGIDILARVDAYPKPDEKVRTTSVSVLGGGNTANTLTAARRLGVSCSLVSKVGKDMYGHAALKELQEDGVDTSLVVSKSGVNTSFTYVIVDSKTKTRTCIATVSNEDLLVTEVNEDMLRDVTLLVLDGRHTLAALQLAKLAKLQGIPILLDVERDRPYIRDLLPFADYIITNSVYPFVFAPDASGKIDAMQRLLERSDAKFVITTLGASGSVMLQRENTREKGSGPDMVVRSRLVKAHKTSRVYEVIECPSWPVENLVDTTGAGDAFIGGVVYGIVTKMDHERMLCLASHIAAAKIEGIGSRSGLPRRENIAPALLVSLPVL